MHQRNAAFVRLAFTENVPAMTAEWLATHGRKTSFFTVRVPWVPFINLLLG